MRRSGFRKSSIVCMIQGELHRKTVCFALPAFDPSAMTRPMYVIRKGCKRIHVESHWFKDWSPNNGHVPFPSLSSPSSAHIHSSVIHKPYPTTHWCPVPPEDKTNKPLCRPLPVKVKPPPPKAPAPVVGSSMWVDTKNGPPVNTPKVGVRV